MMHEGLPATVVIGLTLPSLVALVSVAFATGGVEAADSFPVRCSKSCNGQDTCAQMCVGEMKQTAKCPPMAACPKPNDNPVLCPSGPENCQFAPWSEWKNDTLSCSGLCIRKRTVASLNRCGGDSCNGTLTETKTCHGFCTLIQPKDCELTDWTFWSNCGDPALNQRQRTRDVRTGPAQGGTCGGSLTETQVCAPAISGSDCVVSPWMPWNPCTKTCGGGQHERFRTISQMASAGGNPCTKTLAESAVCNAGIPCESRNCVFSQWGEWMGWMAGGAQKTRTRVVQSQATADGQACTGALQETQPWDTAASTTQDCEMSVWSEWGICDKTCGGGQTFRQKTITKESRNGGKACGGEMKETKECNTDSCAIATVDLNCKLSQWSAWTACSATCGKGMQIRKRSIDKPAQTGGTACTGPLETMQSCNSPAACTETDCQWDDWGPWSDCPVTCGEGQHSRSRDIKQNATSGGKHCASSHKSEVQRCSSDPCQKTCKDGSWANWGGWSICTKSCKGGYQSRNRSIASVANSCGKNASGVDVETQSCNAMINCAEDVDCLMSQWSTWQPISLLPQSASTPDGCGSFEWRSRDITTHGKGHGLYCGVPHGEGESLVEGHVPGNLTYADAKCGITKKIDCKFGDWASWGACSTTCEGGIAKRERKVAVQPSRTGLPCKGSLLEEQPCNEGTPCSEKVDCQWAPWSDWGTCAKCSGQKNRTRSVAKLPLGGGKPCDAEASKEVARCPKDCGVFSKYFCIWSVWSTWSSCAPADPDHTVCGNGTRSRKMVLGPTEQQPADGDYASLAETKEECKGDKTEKADCDAGPCGPCTPQDCVLGAWMDWSSPTCEGICKRTRVISTRANECGKPCTGSLNTTKACISEVAVCEKKDCELSSWTEWSKCASSLAQKYRTRSVAQHPRNDGQPCIDHLNETAPCLEESDMVSCQFEAWTDWGSCSMTCGGGHKERKRSVVRESSNGGEACSGLTQQTFPCNIDKCVSSNFRNCELAPWGVWTSCNTTKNIQSYRWRHVALGAIGSGMPCHGHLQETQSCAEAGPVDCKFFPWSKWGACTTSCYGGQQQRSRSIETKSLRGGAACAGQLIQLRPCATAIQGNCKGDACKMSDWQAWSPCNPSCGNGQKERRRTVETPPGPGGAACPSVIAEVGKCESAACPGDIDCEWEDWQDWLPCVPAAGACGVGYKRRKRGFVSVPVGGGRLCPPRIKDQLMPVTGCNGQLECCRDAVWGNWLEWSGCSVTCGGGTMTRNRTLATKETWCGKPANGSSIEVKNCNDQSCGFQDCTFSQWTAWLPADACTGLCSEGHAERTRTITNHAHGGGAPCEGSTHEWQRCPYDKDTCTGYTVASRDCVVSDWSSWSECSQTCATGYRVHHRTIQVPPEYGGKACPTVLQELTSCNDKIACSSTSPVACVWSAWTDWTECIGGEVKSSRGHLVAPANGGVACAGPQEKVKPCGVCANSTYSCLWGEWEDWLPCSSTCGTGGSRTRLRNLQASNEPILDSRLYDRELPKIVVPTEDKGAETRHAEDILSAAALGCISLIVALGARSVCLRRRHGKDYESIDAISDRELWLESAGME